MATVGTAVRYVDESGVAHHALVTQRWDGTRTDSDEPIDPRMAINVVYVVDEQDKRDPYGQQIERASSVQGKASLVTAHGRYWEPLRCEVEATRAQEIADAEAEGRDPADD